MSKIKKNILVTGASRGIGKQIARELTQSGYEVFITSRNLSTIEAIADEIKAKGFFACDLGDKNQLENLGEFILEKNITAIVNNAGEYIYGEIETMNLEKIDEIFAVNLLAPIFLSSKATNEMKKQRWGRIINIGSISGVMGEAYASLYSGSKSGLVGFSKALALELAQFNITVNTINPGWVNTELGLDSIDKSDFSLSETIETIPQKRFVETDEVAKLVRYLISDDARGITGQSINLCAGLSVGI